jgi:tetratricopeptide (TPR) repeat protein
MSRTFITGLVACVSLAACSTHTFRATQPDTPALRREESAAVAAYRAGRYGDAEHAIEAAVRAADAGDTPPADRARMLQTRAEIHRVQGRYAAAEVDLAQVIALRETAFGPDDPQVARAVSNLAVVKGDQGKLDEAEQLDRRALGILERALGRDQPDTAMVRCNLAAVVCRLGRCPEAEAEHRRALAARERALGPTHVDVARSLDGLALAISCQPGRYGEAEPLYRRAATIWENAGPSHPMLGLVLRDWGRAAVAARRYAEAEPLYRRSLDIEQDAVAQGRVPTHTTASEYAAVLRRLGRDSDAAAIEAGSTQ